MNNTKWNERFCKVINYLLIIFINIMIYFTLMKKKGYQKNSLEKQQPYFMKLTLCIN